MDLGVPAERRRRLPAADLGTSRPLAIEEERRLLYVAMTRAGDDLHPMLPHGFSTASPRWAIGTSTPRAPASSRMDGDLFNGLPGRWPAALPVGAAQAGHRRGRAM